MTTLRKSSIVFILMIVFAAGVYTQRTQILDWYRTLSKPDLPVSLEYQQMLIQDQKEKEADVLAREALVPLSKWDASPAKLIPSPMAAQSLADELGIHVCIVAGVMRYEHKNYYYLNKMVNDYKVQKYFKLVEESGENVFLPRGFLNQFIPSPTNS